MKKDCSDFKAGTFKYKNPELSDWVITRSDSTQTEYDKKNDVQLIGSVEWISNCQYILTYREVNDSSKRHLIGIKINVDIISTSNNSYKYRAYNDVSEIKSEMIKIE